MTSKETNLPAQSSTATKSSRDLTREEILASMNEATRKVAIDGERHISKAYRGIVLVQYDLGKKIAEVVARESVYGKDAVSKLAAYWGISGGATTLYNLRSFATSFTREFVEEWSAKPTKNGGYISLNHWIKLLNVEPSKREEMVRNIVEHGWSLRELTWEIKTRSAGDSEFSSDDEGKVAKRRGGSGRPVKKPTSISAGIESMMAKADVFVKTCEALSELIDEFCSSSEFTGDVESLLNRTLAGRQKVTDLIEFNKKMVRDLNKLAIFLKGSSKSTSTKVVGATSED